MVKVFELSQFSEHERAEFHAANKMVAEGQARLKEVVHRHLKISPEAKGDPWPIYGQGENTGKIVGWYFDPPGICVPV